MTARRHRSRRTAVLAVLAVLVVAAGCGGGDEPASTASSGDLPRRTTAPSTAAPAPDGLDDVAVRLVDLDLGLDAPTDLTSRPGGSSLLVAERNGRIVEVTLDGGAGEGGTGAEVAGTVLDLSERVGDTDAEKGLLGIAVSPDGDELYASYTRAQDGASRIDAYELSGDEGSLRADPDTRRELVAIDQPYPNHNGGSLAVGPDGMLYAGFGDGGAADDPHGNGQDRDTLLGKVLRLDPSDTADGVPDDNPFAAGGGRPEIWLTGVRNPWRISFDAATGDLWIADVGQNEWEEINRLPAADGGGRGANLGWDLYEGVEPFTDADPAPGEASAGPFTPPVFTYAHQDGACSVTGGHVYRGGEIDGLDGAYLYSDYCQGGVRALRVDDAGRVVAQADLGLDVPEVVSFGVGPDAELYVLSLSDGVFRLEAA